MKLGVYISTWICILVVFSVAGKFVDYLLSTELRRKERAKVNTKIQEFSWRLFIFINKADFTGLQQLMIEWVMKLKNKILGENILSCRCFVVSLVISQYLTLTAFCLAQSFDKWPFSDFNYALLVPLLPFTGFSFVLERGMTVTTLLERIGLYWNNYLFDLLAIFSTILLLRIVYKTKKYFGIIAVLDTSLSYLFAYLCIFVYFGMPPNPNIVDLRFTSFIPDIWNYPPPVPRMFLFYSLTTFVPIASYMSMLLFFSVCKVVQWIAATIASDFSADSKKTVFWKLGTAFGVTACLLTEILSLLWKVIAQ